MLDKSIEFSASASGDSLLTVSRAMKLGPACFSLFLRLILRPRYYYYFNLFSEVKDRAILKIYEPGFVEDGTLNIHNSTSTPLDLNVYSDSELLDVELPDFRERNYNTVGSKPARASRERVEPHKRPSSTTPMEMGNRRMYTQQVGVALTSLGYSQVEHGISPTYVVPSRRYCFRWKISKTFRLKYCCQKYRWKLNRD